jgi:hypothetical protein
MKHSNGPRGAEEERDDFWQNMPESSDMLPTDLPAAHNAPFAGVTGFGAQELYSPAAAEGLVEAEIRERRYRDSVENPHTTSENADSTKQSSAESQQEDSSRNAAESASEDSTQSDGENGGQNSAADSPEDSEHRDSQPYDTNAPFAPAQESPDIIPPHALGDITDPEQRVSHTDPLGSWTGVPDPDTQEYPTQDQDDL